MTRMTGSDGYMQFNKYTHTHTHKTRRLPDDVVRSREPFPRDGRQEMAAETGTGVWMGTMRSEGAGTKKGKRAEKGAET